MFHHAGLSKGDLSDQQLKKDLEASLSAIVRSKWWRRWQGAQHVLRFIPRHNVTKLTEKIYLWGNKLIANCEVVLLFFRLEEWCMVFIYLTGEDQDKLPSLRFERPRLCDNYKAGLTSALTEHLAVFLEFCVPVDWCVAEGELERQPGSDSLLRIK